MFFNLVLSWVLFLVRPSVCSPQGLFFSSYSSTRPFLCCFFYSPILLQNRFVSFAFGYWFVLAHFSPTVWWIFLILEGSVLFILLDPVPILLLFTHRGFFTSELTDGLSQEFEWQQSPQVSRTLLSILTVLNNVLVWMLTTRPVIFKPSSPFNNPLMNVSKAPIMISTVITFMFHSFFFQFPGKVQVLIFLFTFFQFYSVVSWDSKVHNFASSLFCWLL